MTIGEPFNPWRGACGFYPPDVVRRIPGVVLGRRMITDGQKLLYERLVRFAGQNGFCYPAHEMLAKELGKSSRQIRSDLEKLEKIGLIRHHNRHGRRSNTYEFLWHELFEKHRTGAEPGLPEGAPNDDLSGTTLPVNATDPKQPEGFERKPASGQATNLSGRVLPVSGVPVGFERKPSVSLSGSTLPTNSVQEFSTHTLSGFVDGSRGRQPEQAVTVSERACAGKSRNGFEEFQSRYPEPKQHVKIESACRAYVGRIEGVAGEHQRLMEGLARYRASEEWQRALMESGGRFIPSMERFIAEGMYLDHPPAAAGDEDETGSYDGGGLEEFRRQELGG